MFSTEAVKVAITVQVVPGVTGGVAQALAGLVHSLGQLDGPEGYQLIVQDGQQHDWLKPLCGPNQHVVFQPGAQTNHNGTGSRLKSAVKRALGPALPAVKTLRDRLLPAARPSWQVPVSDGFIESLGCDVIHFPAQFFTRCAIPSVYNPHDLQHLHYPEFFDESVLAWREIIYPAACRLAHTVVVGSQWIKDDVHQQYGIDPEKLQIIPYAAPNQTHPHVSDDELKSVREKYRLEQPFCFYPAVTWAHKNHLRLLDAIALLRDEQGLTVRLVCGLHWFEVPSALAAH
jgi:hypothetical protein